jgi:hypothetical protein
MLMEQAEDWTRDKGCGVVYVRSGILREKAHSFYRGIGYDQTKTLHLFQKDLEQSG